MPIMARSDPWNLTVETTRDRDSWRLERERIDLAAVATNLLGPAAKASGGRLWWRCPFHEERTPSFVVETKPGGGWRCFGCGERGDAAALVMRLRGMTFPEARAVLTGRDSLPRPGPGRPTARAGGVVDRLHTTKKSATPAKAAGLPSEAAAALVGESAARLWTPHGADALAALRGRGIGEHIIRAARLGYCPGVELPTADGERTYRASGIVIPWTDDRGRLALVKVRQPEGAKPKYAEAYRDGAALAAAGGLYRTPATIRAGRPVALCEGELDALALATALGGGAAVVSGGNADGCAKAAADPAALLRLAGAPRWYIATDADQAGDRAAAAWTQPCARRVRPPEGVKDWCDLARASWSGLMALWADALGVDPYESAERDAIRGEGDRWAGS